MNKYKKSLIKFSIVSFFISGLILCGSDSQNIYKLIFFNSIGIFILFLSVWLIKKYN